MIIHLVAVSHANKSNKDPHNTFDHSLRTLENALDASRSVGAHFIYMSSSMVYEILMVKQSTHHKLDPIGIYGTLKLCGEQIVKAYNQVFETPYTIIRPSALYGEGVLVEEWGKYSLKMQLEEKISINGDGEEKLDFTYIKDLVGEYLYVLKIQILKNQIFNLTYGLGRKINELIEILNKISNIEIEKKIEKNLPLKEHRYF